MSVVLHVDGDRWRTHLRAVADNRPGLVPVIKGNGYGFGLGRLARKATWLGVDTVAVGTVADLEQVASRFDGDVLVLTPWRPFESAPLDSRLIVTVDRPEDLEALIATASTSRVVLELLTSMKRHGFTSRGLREAMVTARAAGIAVEGVAVHLPLAPAGGNLAEAEQLMTEVIAAGASQVWVSHLSTSDIESLTARYPEVRFRQRIGTELWLGDRGALAVRAHVLDSHPIERGETYGYRGRSMPRSGTLLIVSGGTAHGIGLEAPSGESSVKARASRLARGSLDAIGLTRSPYSVGGKVRYFAEPPHMQASMLYLPADVAVPEIGDTVELRVRFTATDVDSVEIS